MPLLGAFALIFILAWYYYSWRRELGIVQEIHKRLQYYFIEPVKYFTRVDLKKLEGNDKFLIPAYNEIKVFNGTSKPILEYRLFETIFYGITFNVIFNAAERIDVIGTKSANFIGKLVRVSSLFLALTILLLTLIVDNYETFIGKATYVRFSGDFIFYNIIILRLIVPLVLILIGIVIVYQTRLYMKKYEHYRNQIAYWYFISRTFETKYEDAFDYDVKKSPIKYSKIKKSDGSDYEKVINL